jgi:outer membrane protein OmpU
MKHILASAALLALTSGLASAEITLSGDARMGLIGNGDDVYFTHRVRAKFTLSGESDAGFSFGASFRPSNAYEAADGMGAGGEVFISGAFGTLTMGSIDDSAQVTVGQVDGVGLTGLGDLNEIIYLGNEYTAARYDYASGGLSFSASVGQNGYNDYSVAAAYSMDGYKFSVGYESSGSTYFRGNDIFGGADESSNEWSIYDHIILGADATVGSVTFKARYGMGSGLGGSNGFGDADLTQYALSATYTMDALALTAFVAASDVERVQGLEARYDSTDRFGIGASYDLGGGAALKAGYASVDYEGCAWFLADYCYGYSDDVWDLGLSFEF